MPARIRANFYPASTPSRRSSEKSLALSMPDFATHMPWLKWSCQSDGIPQFHSKRVVPSRAMWRPPTFWSCTATSDKQHLKRDELARILDRPLPGVHLYDGHIGGGFGVRGELYPEDVLACLGALRLRRPS